MAVHGALGSSRKRVSLNRRLSRCACPAVSALKGTLSGASGGTVKDSLSAASVPRRVQSHVWVRRKHRAAGDRPGRIGGAGPLADVPGRALQAGQRAELLEVYDPCRLHGTPPRPRC